MKNSKISELTPLIFFKKGDFLAFSPKVRAFKEILEIQIFQLATYETYESPYPLNIPYRFYLNFSVHIELRGMGGFSFDPYWKFTRIPKHLI